MNKTIELPATAAELEVIKHIEEINAPAQEWMEEDHNRWISLESTDLEYIRERGYTSVARYNRLQNEKTYATLYDYVYGVKADYPRITQFSDQELTDKITELTEMQTTMDEEAIAMENNEIRAYEAKHETLIQ